MKAAARVTAYWVLRGKDKLPQVQQRAERFKKTLLEEYEKEKKKVGK